MQNEIKYPDALSFYKNPISLFYNFSDGAQLNIQGVNFSPFNIEFIDGDTGEIKYRTAAGSNTVVKAPQAYFINWNIKVTQNGKILLDYHLDLKDQKVYIAFHSSALGDTLAWMPYVEAFRIRHQCKMVCFTFFNNLFIKSYPEIEFVDEKTNVENVFAHYKIAYWGSSDARFSYKPMPSLSVQEIIKSQLGLLNLGELKPILRIDDIPNKNTKPTVCIATKSTMKCKLWNNPSGWSEVVTWLIGKGYHVVNVSIGGTIFRGVESVSKSESLESIAARIKNCDFFIGLPSGLSWMAWALNRPVVMISGISEPWCEFPCLRVCPPEGKCHGCFNKYHCKTKIWNWCPENRSFECTKSITADMVKEKVLSLLGQEV